jgi:hypothetical protein
MVGSLSGTWFEMSKVFVGIDVAKGTTILHRQGKCDKITEALIDTYEKSWMKILPLSHCCT